jgi:hypothetical protein
MSALLATRPQINLLAIEALRVARKTIGERPPD